MALSHWNFIDTTLILNRVAATPSALVKASVFAKTMTGQDGGTGPTTALLRQAQDKLTGRFNKKFYTDKKLRFCIFCGSI
jgi:hypothetical protein